MTQDLVGIRRQLKQVNSFLRQGKSLPAVQYVLAAVRLVLTTPLMKNEREELEEMIREGIGYLGHDGNLRKLYPLALDYKPGGERALFDQLTELLEILKDETVAEAGAVAAAMAARKEAALTKGQEHLDAKEYDSARAVFGEISREYPDDSQLKAAIGEKVLNAGLYEDAVEFLSDAVTIDPSFVHAYNKLAIALRKLGRFDVAEGYYMRVLPLVPDDAYLRFNIGRLYLEWEKWTKAVEFGEKALALKPDFAEAGKLVTFAKRKLEG